MKILYKNNDGIHYSVDTTDFITFSNLCFYLCNLCVPLTAAILMIWFVQPSLTNWFTKIIICAFPIRPSGSNVAGVFRQPPPGGGGIEPRAACGQSSISVRVAGGSGSLPGEWPWAAAIGRRGEYVHPAILIYVIKNLLICESQRKKNKNSSQHRYAVFSHQLGALDRGWLTLLRSFLIISGTRKKNTAMFNVLVRARVYDWSSKEATEALAEYILPLNYRLYSNSSLFITLGNTDPWRN